MRNYTSTETAQGNILGYSKDWLTRNKAIFTATEISEQPALWRDSFKKLLELQNEVAHFLNRIYSKPDLNIILTGAGTSAYIGETLAGYYKKYTLKPARAISTTDLVTSPEDYFHKETPTLLISFARSGNSPESTGAIDMADQVCDEIYHLIITCNESGNLAKREKKENCFCLVLPPESNDKSLAMTGSYTSMLLTGMSIARVNELKRLHLQVELISSIARHILSEYASKMKEVASMDFNRAIFLGSGPLLGVAREAHLKVQELSDGKVVGKYDSFLGLRHGPKAVINNNSLIVYHFSNNSYSRKYERDLVKEIAERNDGMFRIGIGKNFSEKSYVDLSIDLPGAEALEETMLAVCSIIPAQILAFYKSIELGLSPDTPSVNGNISRVVKGVTIYPYFNTITSA
ncbi:MAG: SIS domain-containing protein [Cytophagaceae bacterium]|nr:SIS domain-containing protein [Cytophagaceae bacterium]